MSDQSARDPRLDTIASVTPQPVVADGEAASTRDRQFGARVARLREDAHQTQTDLAARMRDEGHKWSQPTVVAVEKGERSLRLAEAMDLGAIFGVHVALLAGSDDAAIARRRLQEAQDELAMARLRVERAEAALSAIRRREDG